MAVLMTEPYVTFLDSSGNPLAGGKVFTYTSAAQTTKKATFTDQTGDHQNTNPVILDAGGRASIWLSGSYTIVVKTKADVTIDTTDAVTAFTTSSGGVDNIISDYTDTVIATSDSFIFADATNSNNTRRDTMQGAVDLFDDGLELLSTQTASTDATIDFTSVLTTTYEVYILEMSNVVMSNDGVDVSIRTSTDNSTFDSGAGNYAHCAFDGIDTGATITGTASSSETSINSINGSSTVGSDTDESFNGTVKIYNPLGTNQTIISFETSFTNGSTALCWSCGAGRRISAADVDAFQILVSAGTFSTGEFKLYGVKKS